ncbi:glycosyltransferase family A protein [Malonomonas rubra]|uniref:glycosyltransferase family 2 protein n=1 Tax=Malonomonas rubra TaxID=57040 RepID=UPI0026EDD170|nr:glycosyltransferase family A protein [Malonomonas rubra]
MSDQSVAVLFSVVIPAFNYGHLLSRAIDSALSQECDDIEVIVIDDGSTDNTPQILADYAARYPQRLRALRQENRGLAAVRNLGVDVSKGDYLIFLDADDRLLPGALTLFRDFLGRHGRIDMVFAGHRTIHPDGRIRVHKARSIGSNREANFCGYLRHEFGISNGAVIMARRIFDVIRYPVDVRSSEDVPVFAQTLALFECASLREPVLDVFRHPQSMRFDIESIRKTGDAIVAITFNPEILPMNFMKYYKEFRARQNLSLFRSCYIAGSYAEAKKYYSSGIKTFPSLLLNLSYLRKYLRILFK